MATGRRWGTPGIYLRDRLPCPFQVRFDRAGRTICVGSYPSLALARAAAKAFIITHPPHKKPLTATTEGPLNGTL